MSTSLQRIAAILRADFLLRFRRVSTLVCFLLLSAIAYLWVPAPESGRALVVINGHRAINNSGAVGLATASLGMIFVGLFGYYFISNTIRRDLVSRCGIVAASTPMRSAEYLGAKFLGNLAFLVTFVAGFMLSSMAMLLVRGEAPLEPTIFIRQYLLLTPPAMVFVSAVAVLFEAIPFLAGKLGDVLYFILWLAVTGIAVGDQVSGGRLAWAHFFDLTGFGFMIGELRRTLHTESLAIGASNFDPTLPPIAMPGLTLPREWVLPRLVALLAPLTLLPLAVLCFHRFDPARTGRTADKSRRNWIGRLQGILKPISGRFVALLQPLVPGGTFAHAVWRDALLTFTLSPLALVAWISSIVIAITTPLTTCLPLIFGALCLIIADTTTRDLRAGTTPTIRAVPWLRENFVWWKSGSAIVVSLFFLAVPLLLTAARFPTRVGLLLLGAFVAVTAATSLGVLTSNPKTFIAASLTFGYLVINDGGKTPLLDFAGFYGSATGQTIVLYSLVTLVAFAAAQLAYRQRLARNA